MITCCIADPNIRQKCTCAGISERGRTGICVFEGIMKKELFVEILEGTLLLFINNVYPDGHKFMQDNDPKHTSGYASQWM